MNSRWIRSRMKQVLYRSGAMGLYHRWRNRRSITVVMFHRVLPAGDPAWEESDSSFAVSVRTFEGCLAFFSRFYNVVSIDDILNAFSGEGKLPSRPLLITFDDGWADTAEWALPLLEEFKAPAAVFVVAGSIGEDEFWQETVFRAWKKRGPNFAPQEDPIFGEDIESVWRLTARIGAMPAPDRVNFLESVRDVLGRPQSFQMISQEQLGRLRDAGVAIGSHGVTHTPVPYAASREEELVDSRAFLSKRLSGGEQVAAFSFPHGLYDAACAAAARQAGYSLIFTSDPVLTPLPAGGRLPWMLGRINIDGNEVSGAEGELDEEALAFWLFGRSRVALECRA